MGGIQPPWVYSLMALHLGGYPLDHPVMRRGLEGLERFMVEDRGGGEPRVFGAPAAASRRLEACQSPVWDTALAIVALSDGGLPRDHPAFERAARWLLEEEVLIRGDWAVARPELEPGGWAFEFANDNYPDVDDTAEVVLALLRVAPIEPGKLGRVARRRPEGEEPPAERSREAIGGGAVARRACSAGTGGGGRSTRTTLARWSGSSRSWTSGR